VEPSGTPDRGLGAADRLGDLVPGSGHLEHMPSHIYVKTGRWDRAVAQNQKAMRADRTYSARQPVQRRQHGYRVHNAHMLAYAAMMSGREWDAMAAARAMWEIVPEDAMSQVGPYFDRWMCSVYDVQKRFGRWDDLLAEDPPPAYLPITTAVWHAHRTVAYAAKKDFDNAEREFEAFRRAKARIPDDLKWGRDAARTVLEVSDYFIAGEIALHRGDLDEAASLLERAAEIEDTLGYGEPPQWLQPTRHTLGAVYLTMGRPEDAERVYREDLAKWRNNGWSLYGLGRALEAQGRAAEARDVQRQYAEAWGRADSMTETRDLTDQPSRRGCAAGDRHLRMDLRGRRLRERFRRLHRAFSPLVGRRSPAAGLDHRGVVARNHDARQVSRPRGRRDAASSRAPRARQPFDDRHRAERVRDTGGRRLDGARHQRVPVLADCPADLDGDGTVGILDFLALLAAWGPCP
jgi:tetratricopeptide (TPR) repeat protein